MILMNYVTTCLHDDERLKIVSVWDRLCGSESVRIVMSECVSTAVTGKAYQGWLSITPEFHRCN